MLAALDSHSVVLKSRRGYAFWSDVNNDRIIRSHLNASERVVVVTGGMSCVCKFAVQCEVTIVPLALSFR